MENFNVNASFVSVDVDAKSCTVSVDTDGWDSQKQAYNDIDYFAEGSNDPMAGDIQDELDTRFGLMLVFPGEVDDDGTTITFDLEEV